MSDSLKALQLACENLCKDLEEQGLVTPRRKLPKGQHSFNTWIEHRCTVHYDADGGDEHTDPVFEVTATDVHPLTIEEQDSLLDECIQDYMNRSNTDE